MRRVTVVSLCLALSLAGAALAQAANAPADQSQSPITAGELSAQILKAATGSAEANFDARSSLLTAQRLGLVPTSWKEDAVVTAHDLEAVLKRLGAEQSDMLVSDGPVTSDEAARQIDSHAEAIRTLIASGTELVELPPTERNRSIDLDVVGDDMRQVRDLSASEF